MSGDPGGGFGLLACIVGYALGFRVSFVVVSCFSWPRRYFIANRRLNHDCPHARMIEHAGREAMHLPFMSPCSNFLETSVAALEKGLVTCCD